MDVAIKSMYANNYDNSSLEAFHGRANRRSVDSVKGLDTDFCNYIS